MHSNFLEQMYFLVHGKWEKHSGKILSGGNEMQIRKFSYDHFWIYCKKENFTVIKFNWYYHTKTWLSWDFSDINSSCSNFDRYQITNNFHKGTLHKSNTLPHLQFFEDSQTICVYPSTNCENSNYYDENIPWDF